MPERLIPHVDVPVDQLVPHPENARRGATDEIKQSLIAHGQYKPLIVQKSSMHVLAGNHTLAAMRDLEWVSASVLLLDVDDDQARRILLVDNRTSDLARYDEEELLALLKGLDGLAGTGYRSEDVDELRRLTGDLADDQSEFLDDLADDGADGEAAAGGRNHFQLVFPVSQEQRDHVNSVLNQVQADRNLGSSVEALLAVIDDVRVL